MLTSSGHFFIMLKVSPVGDGAVLVDVMAMTLLNSSSVIFLLNISFISVQSCGLFATFDMPYQMLSIAPVGICLIFLTLLFEGSPFLQESVRGQCLRPIAAWSVCVLLDR